MGEIADALKRANEERDREKTKPTSDERGPAVADALSGALSRSPELRDRPSSDQPYSAAQELTDSFGPQHHAPEPTATLEISEEANEYSPARAVLLDHKGGSAEAFRHFALRVSREAALLGNRSILIVSALRGEGKTTTACNLALALATMAGEKHTALVDLDLRCPALARYMGASVSVGIDSVLHGKANIDQARVTTSIPFLDIFPVARPVANPHELLAADILADTLAKLRSRYHTVIIDTPPVLIVPDVELMLPFVGGCVAVARSRVTRVDSFRQLIESLPRDKTLGCFLNEARLSRRGSRYGTYYHPGEESALDSDN